MAAWEASFKKDTILKAFEATSLSPLKLVKTFTQLTQYYCQIHTVINIAELEIR
jgi:hypothetical protein